MCLLKTDSQLFACLAYQRETINLCHLFERDCLGDCYRDLLKSVVSSMLDTNTQRTGRTAAYLV